MKSENLLVEDIIVRFHKPSAESWYQKPISRQAGYRWSLLLKQRQFRLKDFSELYITIVENPATSIPESEQASAPTSGPYRHVYYYVHNIPADDALQELTNQAVYSCVSLFLTDQKEFSILDEVKAIMASQKQDFAVPILTDEDDSTEATLALNPIGQIPSGGKLELTIINKATGDYITRKLFEYANYAVVQAMCNRLRIRDGFVVIDAGADWEALYPALPYRFIISIADFVGTDKSTQWYVGDFARVQETLLSLPEVQGLVVK